MFTWHAWVVLAESATDYDEGSLLAKLDELRAAIAGTKLYMVPTTPIFALNNINLFQCSGSHNHRGSTYDRLLSILTWIAVKLPGSYGLIYWLDDEIPGKREFDGYNVLVLARGKITHRYDPFLSPLTPTVED